jgi:acid phosphatase
MRFSTSAFVASLASVAIAAPATTAASPTATDAADVYAAQATAKTESPTSHVKGKAFDRYVSIWFENTDYDLAAADPNFAFFAKKGITLENLFSVTHPSEPNYMAVVGGYVGPKGIRAVPFTDPILVTTLDSTATHSLKFLRTCLRL